MCSINGSSYKWNFFEKATLSVALYLFTLTNGGRGVGMCMFQILLCTVTICPILFAPLWVPDCTRPNSCYQIKGFGRLGKIIRIYCNVFKFNNLVHQYHLHSHIPFLHELQNDNLINRVMHLG